MSELSILELERETVELLPRREALSLGGRRRRRARRVAVAANFAENSNENRTTQNATANVDVRANNGSLAVGDNAYSVAEQEVKVVTVVSNENTTDQNIDNDQRATAGN